MSSSKQMCKSPEHFVVVSPPATEAGIHQACDMTHFQTCLLHDDKSKRCSGTLKKGGYCVNRAQGAFEPGMMPTCNLHRRQRKRLGWCQAPMRCGFECGRICEWKVHGFQLCLNHREHPMTCYFLRLPIEMRLRIYQFLLPDRPIPAHFKASTLVSDSGGVYTTIFRLNHQIHDEAAGLLYRTRAFTIELYGSSLSMCNVSWNFALEDNRMQRMNVEQHGLDMAMQGQSLPGGLSISTDVPRSHGKSQIFDSNLPIEPVWDPPLSERYFSMIQSFRLEITLSFTSTRRSPNTNAASQNAAMSKLLDCCDHLHRLIARLGSRQRPIARLEIVIKICNAQINHMDAFRVAQFLLRPFRRLRNLAKPSLLSITMQDSGGEIELLTPGWVYSPAGGKFATYLTHLFERMSSSQAPTELPVFKAYWQLQRLLSYMQVHCCHADPKIGEIARLLCTARFAREDEDLTRFRKIWNHVVDIWFDFLRQQAEFQANVTLSIDAIYSTVHNDF